MRPTVYGKEFCIRDRKCVGINIGYNYYCEHEDVVLKLIDCLNGMVPKATSFDKLLKKDGRSFLKKVPVHPAFKNCRLLPDVPYFKTDVLIDNRPLKGKYNVLQLSSKVYTLYVFGWDLERVKRNVESKSVFTEEDFSYLPDYQISKSIHQSTLFRDGINMGIVLFGSWYENGFLILIAKDNSICPTYQIEYSLKNGYLALCDGHAGLFKDRGLSLIFLDKLDGVTNKYKFAEIESMKYF